MQTLPKTIKKGGVEVLATVPPSEDTEYQVEMFMRPTFGTANGEGAHWNLGAPLTPTNVTVENIPSVSANVESFMVYSLGLVDPPEIPNNMKDADLIVWELFRVETEVLQEYQGLSSGHLSGGLTVAGVQGPQMYFWAVGGEPLDVVGVRPRFNFHFPQGLTDIPGTHSKDNLNENTPRAKVTGPTFPVEAWIPDPSKNDNCRYYGKLVGGNATPYVLSYGNTSTVPVLDEHGVGVLLVHGKLYVTTADILGLVAEPTRGESTSDRRIHAATGRFFRFHFRQRRVRNPYNIDLLYREVFARNEPTFKGQTGVSEVTLVQDGNTVPTIEGPQAIPLITAQTSRTSVNTAFLKTT